MSRLSRVPPPAPTALGLRQGDKRPRQRILDAAHVLFPERDDV